jgi:hypothetical protein
LELLFRIEALIRCKVRTPPPGAAALPACCKRSPVFTAARKNLPASVPRVINETLAKEPGKVNLRDPRLRGLIPDCLLAALF